MLKLLSKFIAVFFVVSFLIFAPTSVKGQQMSAMELERANKSAHQFIEEFRKTLDFGSAYEKFFVKNSIQILKKYGFFNIISQDKKFVKKLDDATLKRVYVTEMNIYYLVAVHDLAKYKEGHDSYNDDERLGKPHVIALQESDKHNPLVSSNDVGIKTKSELNKYLKELDRVIELYRKQLTQEIFYSEQYKGRVKQFTDFRKIPPSISTARTELGLKKDTKVYTLQKDIFVFYFVEEKGQLKILTLIIED
jgi:hypothetical protein